MNVVGNKIDERNLDLVEMVNVVDLLLGEDAEVDSLSEKVNDNI